MLDRDLSPHVRTGVVERGPASNRTGHGGSDSLAFRKRAFAEASRDPKAYKVAVGPAFPRHQAHLRVLAVGAIVAHAKTAGQGCRRASLAGRHGWQDSPCCCGVLRWLRHSGWQTCLPICSVKPSAARRAWHPARTVARAIAAHPSPPLASGCLNSQREEASWIGPGPRWPWSAECNVIVLCCYHASAIQSLPCTSSLTTLSGTVEP